VSRQRYTRNMGTMDDQADKTATWRNRRHRMRLECRECEVICERVVYPWQCLRSRCEGIYVYEDGETMYFGCLFKVFTAEFDLAVFSDNPAHPAKGQKQEQEPQPGTAGLAGSVAPTGSVASAAGDEGSGLARRGRARRRSIKPSDPYGPVRVAHSPRPQCLIKVEQAYETHCGTQGCCNPTFFHHPFAAGDDAIKLTAMPSGDDDRPAT